MVKKRFVAMVLCLVLILLTGVPMASAAAAKNTVQESVTITYLEDGYYLVTTLQTYVSPVVSAGAVNQLSGSKTGNLYNGSMDKLCSLTVEGTFSFDGHSSKALSASYSYKIYNVLWSFSSGNADCQGNTATATATFKYLGIQPTTLSVSLSCSPDGVLS